MNDPAVLVLLLEQGDRSLEDHTTDFVFLTNYTHFPDNCLCSFYFAGLNTTTRAQLSGDGPRENFAAYVEWVLVSCNSSLTVDFADDDTSPTLDPEPSQQSPQFAEHEPEPTVDGEPEPNVTDEPSPSGATELRIAQEPEPILSDQVREPATEPATVDVPDGREGAEDSTAHCTAAEAHHLCGGLAAGLPVSIGVMAGGSLVFASSLRVLDSASALRPSGSTPALSSLVSTVARQPTSSTGLPRPSGSALVGRCPAFASGLRSSGSASSLHPTGSVGLLPPSSSTFVLGCSCSAADLRSSASASVARALGSALTLRILGVALDYRLSVSTSGSTSTCSAAVGRPPGVVNPSSTMAPPSVGSTVG
ncbi:hypothetical protein M9458_050943 [Cirrhinus mrigala]|uniref:Uncharacterized protein n=1 Tax=Cirrhinus mrigala TaxID=683832 RepID=A0ABD0MUT8_CIRMR